MHGSRNVTSGGYFGGKRICPDWENIVKRSPYRRSASSSAKGSAINSPSDFSKSKNANESGSINALIRSRENVVPTARLNLQPVGGRRSCNRCERSSGLSIGHLKTIKDVRK